MFSYCENNPVIHSDPSGEFLEAVIGGAIAGAIIGAASTAINAMVTGVPITLKDVAIGAGKGAINGAVSGALSGLMAVKAIAKLPKLAKAAIRLGGSAANAVLAAHTTIKSGGSKREAVFAATTTFIGTAIGTKLPSPSSKDLFSVKTAYNVITGFYFGGSLEAFSSIIQGVIYRSRSR